MAATKAQLRTRVQRKADAVGSSRWDTTVGATGETDQVLGVAYDREWIRVLDAAPELRLTKYTATTDSSGQVSGSDFSSSSARFHRCLGLWGPGGHMYAQGSAREYLGQTETSVYDRVWYRLGSNLQVLPVESGASVKLWVAHLPTAFPSLATEATEITVPTDAQGETFTEIVALEAAALLLFKGGAEMSAGYQLQQVASGLRREMLNDLTRPYGGPVVMQHSDEPWEWAG